MERLSDRPPEGALEQIAFLARSKNRVHILMALTHGPFYRRDLVDETDVSSATVGRVLTELESRGWAERTHDGYVVTPAGKQVTAEFDQFINAMEAIQHLGDAVGWLPTNDLDIGLHHFSDANMRRGNRNSPAAEASHLHDRLRNASTLFNLASVGPPLSMMETMREGVVSGRLTATTVLTESLLEYLQSQPEQVPLWREYITAGADVYCYEGEIPSHLFIVDETVLIGNNQPEAVRPCEFIETDDKTVLSWARQVIESYRTNADSLGSDVFAKKSPTSA